MNKQKRKIWALLTSLSLLCFLSGCIFTNSSDAQVQAKVESLDPSWDDETAVHISLQGSYIEVTPASSDAVAADSGVEVQGQVLTITAAGTYVLQGNLEAGQIIVNATKEDTVRLVLNGAAIQATENAAIYCEQADKLILTLAEGTENTLTDAVNYTYLDAAEEEPNATVFSKDDLAINGLGTLVVNGNFKHGILSKDDLVIYSGTYQINAEKHGIRGRDSVTILDGNFTINAQDDGIQANNDQDETKGWITLEGGTYQINAGHDGIQAETALTITGGTYQIVTGGGSPDNLTALTANTRPEARLEDRSAFEIPRGNPAEASTTEASTTEASTIETAETSDSFKGLKAGANMEISNGIFNLNCADDSLHANGNLAISGGSFTLATGDDAIHADSDLSISAGDINILQSVEGIEGSTISISDGNIQIISSDDGINAAGGDNADQENMFGPGRFTSTGEYWIKISGGTLAVHALQGDGVDSNGDIQMSGGTLLVSGPTNDGNSALDYDGTYSLTGGTLVAAGSSGMAQAPGTTSQQPSLMVYFSSQQQAGSLIELVASDGTILTSYAPANNYQSVVISTPVLQVGANYTLYVAGTKILEIPLTDVITRISDTGAAVTGSMGGPGGGFGGGFGGGRERPAGERPAGGFNGEMPQGQNPGFNGERPARPGI